MAVQSWRPTQFQEKYGVAVYNYQSAIQYGLSLRIGETVQISEETKEWYKGWLMKDPSRKGIFPKNCIALKESILSNPGPYEVVLPITEPIVEEVTAVLAEWVKIWKDFYLERKFNMFTMLRKAMHLLMEYRREIICGKLTKEQQHEVKSQITNQIDLVNSKLGLDLVPRIDGDIVDSDSKSVIEFYAIHVKCADMIAEMQNTQISMPSRSLSKTSTIKKIAHNGSLVAHIYFTYKNLNFNISDAAFLMFGLYEPATSTYISEIFMVKLKFGMPINVEFLGKDHAIFSEVKSADLLKDIYLVCKIYREGKLVADSKKASNAIYRRPFGVGVLELTGLLSEEFEDERESAIQIFNCSEADFHMAEECIIKKQAGKFNTFGSSHYSVFIGLKKIFCDVEKINEKIGSILVPRLGFPDVILPGYVRNDFFVTLFKADFDKGSKSSGKNIEVAMCVVSETGQVFNDCMYIGCGSEAVSEYHSFVLYHANTPYWNETIKITLPSEQFQNAHLRFTFSHCSRNEGKMKGERMFGFSFIKLLQEDKTVIPDSSYGLFIYKFDNSINFTQVRTYLRLPATQAELSKQEESGVVFAGPHRNSKESLTIKTCLCSTKLTQNSNIQYLLRWRIKSNDEIKEALDGLLQISPNEIVKFLQDVFDALFKILSEKPADFSLPVFKAIVSITKIVELRKFELFKSTMTTYIECHFSAALVYRSLADCLCLVVKQRTVADMKSTFVNAMQSLRYIIKMIARSHHLHMSTKNTNTEVIVDLKDVFKKIFQTINEFMTNEKEEDNESKIDVLRNIPELCDDVLKVFTESEFSQDVKQMVANLPKQLSSSYQKKKLSSLQNIVGSRLFGNKDGRAHLLPAILTYLSYLINKKHELASCLELLGTITTLLQHGNHRNPEDIFNDVSMLISSMLGPVLNVLLTIERKGQLTALTVSCLFGILKLMNERHFQLHVDTFQNKNDLRDFLKKLTVAFKELLTMEIYPKDWFLLKTVGNNVMLSTIQYFSKVYIDNFLQGDNFQLQLWLNYFQLGVLFLKQPSLYLESFSTSKREKMISRYGDMRLIMAFEILDMWDLLGDKKKLFIPNLIGPFLEMSLVPEPELRKATIPVFYDMMKVEYFLGSSFKKVESEFIEKLELLSNQNKGDLEFQIMFNEIMTEKFNSSGNSTFQAEGLKSVNSITELLQRLLDYRETKDDEINAAQKMMCTVRLLEFYKELGRIDMYIRNIHKLVKLHLSCSNFTEAGFTLLLHASLLEWSDKELPAFLSYPIQREEQRKEQIYLEIIEFFDKGKMWESGIRLCKELAVQYESGLFDYVKLSEILRRQAYFYDCIMQQMRPAPTYFRVSFFGRGFPHYLKDQVLIFRGLELETLAGFTARINLEFPSAEIMSNNAPPEASIVQGIGQHIQICTVMPVPGEIQMFENNLVNEKISCYYKFNEVEEFVFSRPFHKGEKDRSNEFKTLWLERTIHWTSRKFPSILKWSTIESVRKVELTPLENAIESIISKNKELIEIIDEYQSDSSLNLNRLSMVLNGVIDANVNGGIANYQNAFLSNQYLFFHPEHEYTVQQLKNHLYDQTKIVQQGLEIHESFVSESLKPFHDKMFMMFTAMKASLETGESMEKILSRPNTLHISSSFNSDRNNQKVSPLSNRSPLKSSSLMIDFKKKQFKKSTSLQTMFRRESSAVDNSEHFPMENLSKKLSLGFLQPPLPPRKNTAVSPVAEDFLTEIPNNIPLPALKRLGLRDVESVSAPNLNHIEEEVGPSLPPKRYSILKENSSDGSVSTNTCIQHSTSSNSLNQQLSGFEINSEPIGKILAPQIEKNDTNNLIPRKTRSLTASVSDNLNGDEDVFVNNVSLGSLYEEIKTELFIKNRHRHLSSKSDKTYNEVSKAFTSDDLPCTATSDKPVSPFRVQNSKTISNDILNTPPLPAKLSKTRNGDGLTFL
ncbi:dedicator of cytokinesis protein 3 isoform X1 [Hydra vulgaris]|uniref:dedicator of cytokinesis protein 3 isoform X1 n=1 Tax=Hydra vulgaris TaxID=6087 RepID=UPI001F5F6A84|nr:dedicator of cytokinesis protein 3 isoform X1 [Hydra vulgaris]XP_047127015.1 dedicator of cytokinesis protein 3 isoform X1 [Hydra vulgaris]